jgi:hypothetical protein
MNRREAIGLIGGCSPPGRADLLVEHLLPSARIVVRDGPGDSVEDSAASRLGGVPALPRGENLPLRARHDYVSAQIARLEEKFKATPRATGLRDFASRMRRSIAWVDILKRSRETCVLNADS